MNIDKLTAIVTILITLSIASERLVEIVKSWFPQIFAEPAPPQPDENGILLPEAEQAAQIKETERKARINLLAIGCGMITALIASPLLASIFKDLFPVNPNCNLPIFNIGTESPCGFGLNLNGLFLVPALGLLASGGSVFWNSILEYLLKIKDLKKIEVKRKEEMRRIDAARERSRLLEEVNARKAKTN